MSGLSTEQADLIARTRALLDVTAVEPADMAEQIGALKYLADALCVELEDASDPAGRGERLLARAASLKAKLDAQAEARALAR